MIKKTIAQAAAAIEKNEIQLDTIKTIGNRVIYKKRSGEWEYVELP